uniref:Internal scaffolding protein n=1 Tax=Dulem virus 161 TaxID=3145638 RepID=A0AAU8B0A8_9VIRU
MRFTTQYESHSRVFSNLGSRDHILYSPVLDENGHLELEESGVENIYDMIQSHKDSCDINLLVKRFAAGEIDVLEKRQGQYLDVTQFPVTYAEMLNNVIDGEKKFYELPVEVRARFGHSFTQWLAAMDNMPDWLSKMGVQASADASDGKTDTPKSEGDVAE